MQRDFPIPAEIEKTPNVLSEVCLSFSFKACKHSALFLDPWVWHSFFHCAQIHYLRLPRHRNISKVILGVVYCKSGNSCFTGIKSCIFFFFFLQTLDINHMCFILVWIKIETSQIKVRYSLIDINVIRGI